MAVTRVRPWRRPRMGMGAVGDFTTTAPPGLIPWAQIANEAGIPIVATWGGGAPNGASYTGPYQQVNPADYANLYGHQGTGGFDGFWLPNSPTGYDDTGLAIAVWVAPEDVGAALPVAPAVSTAVAPAAPVAVCVAAPVVQQAPIQVPADQSGDPWAWGTGTQVVPTPSVPGTAPDFLSRYSGVLAVALGIGLVWWLSRQPRSAFRED